MYFLLHSFRNLMQYFGVENFLTTTGHGFGVWYTDWLLSLIGLSYSRKMEIYFFGWEMAFGVILFWLGFRKNNEKN